MIETLLRTPAAALAARVLVTFVFWSAGLAHLANFSETVGFMHAVGVEPAVPFAVLAVLVLLGGSVLVIADRWTWFGAGALATFTLLTIPLAHAFWRLQGEAALGEMRVAMEHVSLVGGLLCAAVLSKRRRTVPRRFEMEAAVLQAV